MNNNPNNNSALLTLADAAVRPLGFEVLEVTQTREGRELTVLVRIDRLDEQPVTMEDLTAASRAAEAEFDRVDPVPGEYRLEFESPGSKRPLLRARHFERMLGLKAKVRGGEHNFTAPIKAVSGDLVTFDCGGQDVKVSVHEIQAHLAEFPDRHR
ncbi:ribosome maturation factor RimP [Deinococcus reticulitermitis]|uniref:Ribosome maturation factor RimP n=1 Tax=Deinococcus reticulitermitis TaxID=856736 RepID=A0A1H6VY18_9DEIO|nr:ribosome maturation factor RimP [Deinococcus reticulitermitis]SEJ05500.1 ribosome maturation factor RimP [Deinococcus reticulitermitis]